MGYEEEYILKFFGLDTYSDGDPDPELAACEISATTDLSNAVCTINGVNQHFFIKDKALVLNAIQAKKVAVTIVNISGQIQYSRNLRVGTANSLSIPVSSLPAGYYIASVRFNGKYRRTTASDYRFVKVN